MKRAISISLRASRRGVRFEKPFYLPVSDRPPAIPDELVVLAFLSPRVLFGSSRAAPKSFTRFWILLRFFSPLILFISPLHFLAFSVVSLFPFRRRTYRSLTIFFHSPFLVFISFSPIVLQPHVVTSLPEDILSPIPRSHARWYRNISGSLILRMFSP